jgi:hypothetical protein
VPKYDGRQFNVDWHEKHQEATLMIFVRVDQVTGTHASMTIDRWEVPYALTTEKLAKYTSDSKDNSREALWTAMGRLTTMHAQRLIRAQELGFPPY